MFVQQPQNGEMVPNGSVARSPKQYRSIPFMSSGGPQHTSSIEDITPISHVSDYTETDYLLPNQLYRRSTINSSLKMKGTGGSGAPAETVCHMVLQILVPFLLAGLGTVSAGMLLEVVQNWDVFVEITEILILVPAVLGMKGNLEMTLASRLSTAVHSGKMELPSEKWMLIVGNLSLKQLQATVLGLLASLMATLLGWMAEGKMPLNHMVLLCSSSVSTTFVASLLQGIIMVGIIMGSKRMGINPDNVATPMAASFGDLITLALLAGFSQSPYLELNIYPYVLYLVDLLFVSLIPLWVVISSKHPDTHILLRTGWEPIITAMHWRTYLDKTVSDPNLAGIIVYCLSSCFPDHTCSFFFFFFKSGIGGNLVSIQSSRISTGLHLKYAPGEVPGDRVGPNHRSAQVLLFLVIPGQFVFLYTIHLMKGGHSIPSALFTVLFLSASLLQVIIADYMGHYLWRKHKDPDSYSIPYLTALGDLLGLLSSLSCFSYCGALVTRGSV
uniref:Solute carrier family 41 member n=1 Tax=Sphaeramia orbicularis TaxID=375764 RepID=A0A672YGG6_9TELE